MSVVLKGLAFIFVEVAGALGLLKHDMDKSPDGEKKKKQDSDYDPNDLYDPTPQPIDYGTMP